MLKTIPEIVAVLKESTRLMTAIDAAIEIKLNGGLVIDVREPSECASISANGTINIPRGLLEMKVLALETDPARPIYLHCASGVRAMFAAEQLARVGYENVSVITCSMTVVAETTFDAS